MVCFTLSSCAGRHPSRGKRLAPFACAAASAPGLAVLLSRRTRARSCWTASDRFFATWKRSASLHGLRSASSYRAGVLTAAIAAHMGDFGMRLHPGRCGFLLTVRQEIKDVVPLQIHQ